MEAIQRWAFILFFIFFYPNQVGWTQWRVCTHRKTAYSYGKGTYVHSEKAHTNNRKGAQPAHIGRGENNHYLPLEQRAVLRWASNPFELQTSVIFKSCFMYMYMICHDLHFSCMSFKCLQSNSRNDKHTFFFFRLISPLCNLDNVVRWMWAPLYIRIKNWRVKKQMRTPRFRRLFCSW